MAQHEHSVRHKKNSDAILKQDLTKFLKTTSTKSVVKEFELRYSVSVACHGSISSVDHSSEIIKEHCNKSELCSIQLYNIKCSKVIANVVAKSYIEDLVEQLRNCEFSLLIDEFKKKENEMKTEF